MDDIFISLHNMQWDFEQIKKNSTQKYTFITYGAENPMYGLKGENHPSSYWHKNMATLDYYDMKRGKVLESWMHDDIRRKQHSDKMKERWASGKITPEIARKNGQHGLKGEDIHNTLAIEYKGMIYYGWRELQEKTNVSKHLYKKYYTKGMDPESRIGCNGPNPFINAEKLDKEVSV